MTLESPHKKMGNLKLMLKFKHFTNPGIDFCVAAPVFRDGFLEPTTLPFGCFQK